jgi:nicotinamide N-methyltransferase
VILFQFKKPSFLKRISMFGTPKRPPQLTAAEQLIQHSIRKRATAFVDARDDLETKIGRLSRRLNFLMTESDLWRDKFVTFEQYAEKLSAEANQLRTKINKEQRETKRLSGLVTLTAVEKTKLQTRQLHALFFSFFITLTTILQNCARPKVLREKLHWNFRG